MTQTAWWAGAIQGQRWTESSGSGCPWCDRSWPVAQHWRLCDFVLVVNEVATGSIRAEADRVVGAAQLGFIFRMPGEAAEFTHAMRELALVAIFTHAELLEWAAQLRLVAGRVDCGGCDRRRGG